MSDDLWWIPAAHLVPRWFLRWGVAVIAAALEAFELLEEVAS